MELSELIFEDFARCSESTVLSISRNAISGNLVRTCLRTADGFSSVLLQAVSIAITSESVGVPWSVADNILAFQLTASFILNAPYKLPLD